MKTINLASGDLYMTPSEYRAWAADIFFKGEGAQLGDNHVHLFATDTIVRRRPKTNPYTFVSKLGDYAARDTLLRLFLYLEVNGFGQPLQVFLANDKKVYAEFAAGAPSIQPERFASESNVVDLLQHLRRDPDDYGTES